MPLTIEKRVAGAGSVLRLVYRPAGQGRVHVIAFCFWPRLQQAAKAVKRTMEENQARQHYNARREQGWKLLMNDKPKTKGKR